jgi:hypothetical protein
VCIWGGLHAGFVFWGLRYPFSYRTFKLLGRARYAHIISVLVAVLLPLPAALIHLKGGYVITANPSLTCAGRNTDYTYYTFVLPLSVMLTITTCLIVLIFWTLLKVSVHACTIAIAVTDCKPVDAGGGGGGGLRPLSGFHCTMKHTNQVALINRGGL